MLRDRNGEPAFPPGALWRLLALIGMIALSHFVYQGLHSLVPGEEPKVMPRELREAAADCILTSNLKSCAIYEAAKPDYPIDPGRAGR
jgi:hypothetical protein